MGKNHKPENVLLERGKTTPRVSCRNNDRLISTINLLRKNSEPATIKHISLQLDIPVTMVYRIVATLQEANILQNIGSTVAKVSIKDDYRHLDKDQLNAIIRSIPRLHA